MQIIESPKRISTYITKHALDEILPQALLETGELCIFQPCETILEHGQPMHYFYFFVSGKLKVYQTQANGRTLLIQFYSVFDSLGEVELMNDLPASCAVVSVAVSELIRIPFSAMLHHAVDYPPFLRYMVRSLSHKLLRADDHHAFNLLFPVKERLASYLLAHVDSSGKVKLMDQLQEIADYLGTTYRQLHRAFDALTEDKVLLRSGKSIQILDFEALESLAGEIYAVSGARERT